MFNQLAKKFSLALVSSLVFMWGAGATPIGFATDFNSSSLYAVDMGAGTATLIGSTGFTNVTGLSYDASGTLYGVDHSSGSLITLDTTTGAGTLVGSLGVSVFDVGIAFDAAGNLYMSSDSGGGGNDFFSINAATGAATLIGSTGTSGVVGLAFDDAGTLFGLVDTSGNSLVTIDTITGAATVVGNLGFSTNTGGISFADNGDLHGALGFVNAGFTVIDPNTGLASAATDLGIDFAGLALNRATAIPEPSSLALLALGLAAIGAGRRRK